MSKTITLDPRTHERDYTQVGASQAQQGDIIVIWGPNSERNLRLIIGVDVVGAFASIRFEGGGGIYAPNTDNITVHKQIRVPATPKAPEGLMARLMSDYYTTKLPYGKRGDEAVRAAYRADVERLNREFREDLECDECNDKLPPAVRERIFSAAWERGHSSGHSEVASCYTDIHDLALFAFEAGTQAPGRS